jgi:hypothetical protein
MNKFLMLGCIGLVCVGILGCDDENNDTTINNNDEPATTNELVNVDGIQITQDGEGNFVGIISETGESYPINIGQKGTGNVAVVSLTQPLIPVVSTNM